MRIVIATPFYPPQVGVLAVYAEGIERAMRGKGFEVAVMVRGNWFLGPLSMLAYFIRLLFSLRKGDVVLSLDMWSVALPSALAARLRGVPLLVRIGGDFLWEMYIERTGEPRRLSEFYTLTPRLSLRERCIRASMQMVMRQAKHLFFNTNFQLNLWQKAYALPSGKVSRLENYYPPRVSTLPAERKVFVSINRKARYKSESSMLEAFAAVQKRHPDIEIDMRGLPYDEQLERFARCYAVIIPSISEVGSNIAIETAVRGRPFIISDDTGTKERLGDCGLFIDTRSKEAMEQAIESLLDAQVYDALSSSARKFSFTHSWEEIASEILSSIKQ